MNLLKKGLALLITATVLFTGCTMEEASYLELFKKIAVADGASCSGNFQLKIVLPKALEGYSYLPYMYSAEERDAQQKLLNKFSDLSINYNIEYVKSKGIAQGKFTDSKTGDVMFAFALTDKKLYADVSYIMNTMNEYLSSDYGRYETVGDAVKKETIARKFTGKKYISLGLSDIQELDPEDQMFYTSLLEDFLTLNNFKKSGEVQSVFIDEVLLGALKDFNGDIVTSDNGAYTIKLDTQKSLELIEKLLLYLVDNVDEVAASIGKIIDTSPVDPAIYSYGLYESEEEYRADMKEGINDLVSDIKADKELYKEQIRTIFNKENVGIAAILAFLNGTSVESSLKSVGDVIEEVSRTNVSVKAGIFTTDTFKMEILSTVSVEPVSDISVIIPENELTVSTAAVTNDAENPKAMVIHSYSYPYDEDEDEDEDLDSVVESATWAKEGGLDGIKSTSASIRTYSGFSSDYMYLPTIDTKDGIFLDMDRVGKFFGESFTYDGQGYAVNNGQLTKVRHLEAFGKHLININDLVELGYTINMDFENNVTIIVKK